jgi:hypothetical protein
MIRTLLPKSPVLLLVSILIATALGACNTTPAGRPAQAPPGDVEIYGDLERIDPRGQIVVYWHQQAGEAEEAWKAWFRDRTLLGADSDHPDGVYAEGGGGRKTTLPLSSSPSPL